MRLQDDFSPPSVFMIFNLLVFQAIIILYYFTVLIIVGNGLCMWSSIHINKGCVMMVGIGDY